MLNKKTKIFFTATSLMTASIVFMSTSMADNHGSKDVEVRAIGDYQCREIMRYSGAERDIALGFLMGYTLGKKGNTTFDAEALSQSTENFLDACLDNPNDSAAAVMNKVIK